MTQTSSAYQMPAGWYPDPGGGGRQRYWDGTGWTQFVQPPPQPPRPARPWLPWAIVIGALALVGILITAVVVGTRPDNPPVGPGAPTAPAADGITTDYLLSLIGSDASSAAVSQLDQLCGSNIDQVGNLECPSLGFEITFDPSLTATRVILYPQQEDSMSAYTGELPGGVTWSDSYPDVVARLGEPASLEGGFGAIDITVHYEIDGYDVGYGLDTWYNRPEYLQNAHLTSITIRPL